MRRPRYAIPADVEQALAKRRLTRAYGERPDYQRNDYIGWITQARLPATRRKRVDQMLDELASGGLYMGMAHNTSRKGR